MTVLVAIVALGLGEAGCDTQKPGDQGRAPHASLEAPHTTSPVAVPGPAEKARAKPLSLEYLEISTGHAKDADPAPLIIALHGLGDTPHGFLGLFDGFMTDAHVIAPHSKAPYSDGFEWFPPGTGTSDLGAPSIREAASQLATFIDEAAKATPTLGKPIVLGFSQGGALSYAIAALDAEAVAAAVPLSGWLPESLWPKKTPGEVIPILAFHGDADRRVSIDEPRAAIAHLKSIGYPASLREFAGAGHGIPPVEHEAVFDALSELCAAQAKAGRDKP